jgi:L-lactate dehydrogenase (cytochrome)
MNMRLIGARTIKDLIPEMVDASNINTHTLDVPIDKLYDKNCMFSFFFRYGR